MFEFILICIFLILSTDRASIYASSLFVQPFRGSSAMPLIRLLCVPLIPSPPEHRTPNELLC